MCKLDHNFKKMHKPEQMIHKYDTLYSILVDRGMDPGPLKMILTEYDVLQLINTWRHWVHIAVGWMTFLLIKGRAVISSPHSLRSQEDLLPAEQDQDVFLNGSWTLLTLLIKEENCTYFKMCFFYKEATSHSSMIQATKSQFFFYPSVAQI